MHLRHTIAAKRARHVRIALHPVLDKPELATATPDVVLARRVELKP